MSGEGEIFALLKGVSRSFYISMRFLPRRIRDAIALGYLLARASDTIADTNQLPPSERIAFLERFLGSVSNRKPLDLAACLTAQPDGPEKLLLANIERVLDCLSDIPQSHRELLNEVLTKIVHGQTLDIQRFESKPGISGLADETALEEYTYLVGGCVGEFWTKICLLEWPHYARLSPDEMLSCGKYFGKGLQLVNILRDYPADLQAGRSYLPVSNLEEIALNPTLARPEWERWRQKAWDYLEKAWKYVGAVRPWRVRFACAVPVFIGIRTLMLLKDMPENRAGIKVARSEVRRLMIWAAGLALFRFLEPIAYRKILGPKFHKRFS
ncbi:MAG: squalene/phytoene synthase family protein [Verrucomicrobia bacterium]|nr:squalene/phytoene synthase family protein [Verrucomicrobiota bacterium]MBV9298429.1 squalene/phytoene synthase family protein [Verrucomicrobiota bacterium]